jgi:hypothetical protein
MAHRCARKGELRVNRGNGVGNPAIGKGEAFHSEYLAFERLSELTPPPIRMDCSFSLKRRKLVSAQ